MHLIDNDTLARDVHNARNGDRDLRPGPWRIEPLLLLGQPLQASMLGHARIPVMSAAELERGDAIPVAR